MVVQLRAVFRPSVQYLSLFCEAFSWTILYSSRFPLFHSGQVFHQLVRLPLPRSCFLTLLRPRYWLRDIWMERGSRICLIQRVSTLHKLKWETLREKKSPVWLWSSSCTSLRFVREISQRSLLRFVCFLVTFLLACCNLTPVLVLCVCVREREGEIWGTCVHQELRWPYYLWWCSWRHYEHVSNAMAFMSVSDSVTHNQVQHI